MEVTDVAQTIDTADVLEELVLTEREEKILDLVIEWITQRHMQAMVSQIEVMREDTGILNILFQTSLVVLDGSSYYVRCQVWDNVPEKLAGDIVIGGLLTAVIDHVVDSDYLEVYNKNLLKYLITRKKGA